MLHRDKGQLGYEKIASVAWLMTQVFENSHDPLQTWSSLIAQFLSISSLTPSLCCVTAMEHMVPVTHPAPELDAVIEQQMRKESAVPDEKPQVMERVWGFAARTDSTVTYEEYVYWARIEREMEMEENKVFHAEHGSPLATSIKSAFSPAARKRAKADKETRLQTIAQLDQKQPGGVVTDVDNIRVDQLKVSDAEWRTAARALRTASWGQMFFLITTDILGWSGAP